MVLQLYPGILEKLEKYVKVFQSSKPLCYILHTEMFKQIKDFFSGFIAPVHTPQYSAQKLSKLDVADRSRQVKDRNLNAGEYYFPILKETAKKGNSRWTTSFYTSLREGYIKDAIMMKKLPLLNTTLIQLASLDLSNQHCENTSSSLVKLAESLPPVITFEKLGAVQQESKLLTIETKVSLSEILILLTVILDLILTGGARYL